MGQGKSQFTEEELQDYEVRLLNAENKLISVIIFQDLTYFTKKEVL